MHANNQAFWNTLQASELLTVTQRKWIKKEWFGDKNGDETSEGQNSLSQWLLEKKLLTPYQTQMLQLQSKNQSPTGLRLRPFVYGPFLLLDRLQPPRSFSSQHYISGLTVEHADANYGNARFVTRFVPHADDAVWEKLRDQISTIPCPHLIAPVGGIQLPDYRALLEFDYSKQLTPISRVLFAPQNQADFSLPANQILSITIGITCGLASLHKGNQVACLVTPAEVSVAADGQGYLRSIPDCVAENHSFARMLLGIKSEAVNKSDTNSIVVVTTENQEKQAEPEEWKRELCRPNLVGSNEQLAGKNWSAADFLAPELFAGSPATPASDLYSLGCLLYYLSVGKVPFTGDTWVAKHLARKDKPEIPADVAKPIRKLLDLLLEPTPERRKVTAEKIQQSLRSLLNVESQPFSTLLSSSRIQTAYQWLELQDGRIFPEAEDLPVSTAVQVDQTPSFELPAVVPSVTAGSDISIEAASESPKRRWAPESSKSFPITWIATGAIVILIGLIGFWQLDLFDNEPRNTAETKTANQNSAEDPSLNPDSAEATFDPTDGWTQKVVRDDGRLLWESPTVGRPLQLESLPPNPYAICVIEQDFWTQAPYKKLISAIVGIKNLKFAEPLEQSIEQLKIRQFDQVILTQYQIQNVPHHLVRLSSDSGVTIELAGWKVVGQIESLTTPVSQPIAAESDTTATNDVDISLDSTEQKEDHRIARIVLVRKVDGHTQVAIARCTKLSAQDLQGLAKLPLDRLQEEMFDPDYAEEPWTESAHVLQLTLCDPNLAILTLPESGKTQLTLPMSTALDCSDQQRHFQVITNPVAIWNEAGRTWLGEDRQWLADLIKTQIPLQTRALYLSAHYEENQVYVEAKFVIDRSANAASFVQNFTSKISDASGAVERMILSVPRLEYWDTGLLKFDDMIKQLAQSLRTGQHNKLATINTWLPRSAITNLIAEADLFYTATKFSSVAIAATTSQQSTPKDLPELLQTKRTVKIPEQDLINALVDMQAEIKSSYPGLPFDFQFDLDGNSLLTEGITQNQKITDFEQTQQTLADILTALVLKANPDKSVTTANDPKCKLIWLPHPEKSNIVLVTTRATAEKNGWELPPQVAPQ